ncbi:clathrin heavy chain linker domain-containing protein 1 [Rhinatrema bivittatum]|uniref:clathrin heavy chain linker domain-containing protein 1 n=1 Tax=Rhinatrema bivittatum TaxID=194408 RepID=UPI00112A2BFD|nr:clathrin heavy chain linker domain-containing protein 1 [Rhinatrema bivittatum]XP_029449311.1 clathrin heavy chain linker domain-containing protein 1 [Rhinatrema bivittatum]
MMSTVTPRLNKHQILPPIFNDRDKMFFDNIQKYISTETKELSSTNDLDPEQNYLIYRNVFDKVIEYVTSYKNILTAIKQEYDEFIAALKKAQRDAFYLQGKLKTLTSEPTTLMYYRKRANQLTDKIQIIEKDSSKLQKELQDLRHVKSFTQREDNILKRKVVHLERPIPGLTLEESLDMNALNKRRHQLEKQMFQLKTELKSKYVSVILKSELEEKMDSLLNQINKEESINKKLLLGYQKRKLVLDAISAWTKSDKSVSLTELISQVINEAADHLEGWIYLEEDDPNIMKEGAILLQCIERFNELFESGQYKTAAIFAANCPRGILRNVTTMNKFKAIPTIKGEIPPLLLFFEAVINSSAAVKHPLNALMTLEGIRCALAQKRLDLVIHWITQQRLTFSEALGDVILEYGEKEPYNRAKCLALAQIIYMHCAVHRKAGLCMCLQGQVCGVMEYINLSKQFSLDDYLFLMKNCPNMDLIHCLVNEWNGKPPVLSMGLAVLSLFSNDNKEQGFQLLEHIAMCGEDTLQEVILNDVICTPEGWTDIANECSNNNYINLSEKIISVLISQDGVLEIFSTEDDAKIMEHIFL